MRCLILLVGVALAAACNPPPASSSSPPSPGAPSVTATPPATTAGADIGKPAPDFTLPDTEGHPVHLADHKGSAVVLEWFNPQCPFVGNAHTRGLLQDAAKRHEARGVVWLGINSAAPGKQGHGAEATLEAKRKFNLDHPILLDESGSVGHAYGATNTPHMFVIDAAGTLVYRGAIDNSPDGAGEAPTDGKLVRYVDDALADLAAGRPVRTPSTKAYGCSVKYGRP